MKIFSFIGSPLKKRSNTYTLTKMMLDKLINMDTSLEYDLITAGDVNILSCRGCWSCMQRGTCPLDKKDDMGDLKRKMLDSHFIIWGSPVYAMQVSGQMKTFLDRLAHWYHTLRMAGKLGMTVSTTAGAGLEEVHDYLTLVLNSTGIKVISRLETFATVPETIICREDASNSVDSAIDEIYPYLNKEINLESDEGLENAFQVNKNKVTYGSELLLADYNYWKKHRMLEMDSFSDLLKFRDVGSVFLD